MKRLCDLQSALEIFPSSLIYCQQSRPLGNKGDSGGRGKDQYGDQTERQSAKTMAAEEIWSELATHTERHSQYRWVHDRDIQQPQACVIENL